MRVCPTLIRNETAAHSSVSGRNLWTDGAGGEEIRLIITRMLFANGRAIEVAGERELQIFKFRVMSLVREVFLRSDDKKSFPTGGDGVSLL